MAQVIGVVLAGGAGRRMGRPKGDLLVEGISMAERAARLLHPLCASVLVSLAPDAPNPAPRFPEVHDEPPGGRGPLAGIAAAYSAAGTADLLVLACDYPAMNPTLLGEILRARRPEDDVVLPVDPAGRDHPLAALWARGAEPVVREALERQAYKVRGLLADLEVRRLGPEALPGLDLRAALANANRPADLAG